MLYYAIKFIVGDNTNIRQVELPLRLVPSFASLSVDVDIDFIEFNVNPNFMLCMRTWLPSIELILLSGRILIDTPNSAAIAGVTKKAKASECYKTHQRKCHFLRQHSFYLLVLME